MLFIALGGWWFSALDNRYYKLHRSSRVYSHSLSSGHGRAGALEGLVRALYQAQCFKEVKAFTVKCIQTRTQPSSGRSSQKFPIAKLIPAKCRY